MGRPSHAMEREDCRARLRKNVRDMSSACSGTLIREGVEANGELKVRRVKIDQIIRPAWRIMIQQVFGKIPMGINHRHSVPPVDVLDDEFPQQGCLSRIRLPDNVAMMPGIRGMDAEGNFTAPDEVLTKNYRIV